MVGRPPLQTDVVLSRADAWHRKPLDRLAELRQDVADLQAGWDRAHAAYLDATTSVDETRASELLDGMEDALLERQRYVVTFRRHHRI